MYKNCSFPGVRNERTPPARQPRSKAGEMRDLLKELHDRNAKTMHEEAVMQREHQKEMLEIEHRNAMELMANVSASMMQGTQILLTQFMQQQSSFLSNFQSATPNFQHFPSATFSNINPLFSQSRNPSQSFPNPLYSSVNQSPTPVPSPSPSPRPPAFPLPSAFPMPSAPTMQPAFHMHSPSPAPPFPDPRNH